jgi:hypothetical protein
MSAMTEPRGIWVYGVAEAVPDGSLGELTGMSGGPVAALVAAGLTAVTEQVPLAEFGEAALHRNLEDLDWLEEKARAHHGVIDAVVQQQPLVPMRFATVYHSEAGVTGLLTGRVRDFRALLDRVRARQEWGVKVYAAPPPTAGEAAGQATGSPSKAAGAGAAYLNRRRHERSAQEEARQAAMTSTTEIHDTLSGLVVGFRLHPPQAPQLHGNKLPMLLNAAYLLDDERAGEFTAEVRRLAAEHPSVELDLTGPWPPYSFAELPELTPARDPA